jgi:acetyl/propionyl-CoA carboxylase alpha subunit
MIMKVIAHGESRLHAIERLEQALAGARITGITHNVPYLQSILAHQGFRNAELHTGFLAQAHAEICA